MDWQNLSLRTRLAFLQSKGSKAGLVALLAERQIELQTEAAVLLKPETPTDANVAKPKP